MLILKQLLPCEGWLPPALLETGRAFRGHDSKSPLQKPNRRADDQGQGGQYNGFAAMVVQSLNLLLAQSPQKHVVVLWAWKALGASLSKADVMLQPAACTGTYLWPNSISLECRGG